MCQIKTVVWDWNGTLLNDVNMNLEIVNKMLFDHNIPSISKEHYQSIFTFPIFNFYKALGLDTDKEDMYYMLVKNYNEEYRKKMFEVSLYPRTEEILALLRQRDVQQIILSGQNQKDLDKQIEFFGIKHYFDFIVGSSEKDASDKEKQFLRLIENQNIESTNILVIGDTVYDYQLASALGCQCVLLSHGHQSNFFLRETSASIFTGFTDEFVKLFF